MSDIPQTRERLFALAEELRAMGLPAMADALDEIVCSGMYRHYTKERAPVQSRKMTPMVVRIIKYMHTQHPSWSAQQIADQVGVNPGRVSEVLAGKWDD